MTDIDKQHSDSIDFLEDAIRISRLTGEFLKEGLLTDFSVDHKGKVDLVTEMDTAAQSLIRDEILLKYPGHGILAEEGLDLPGEGELRWIVDPIDGTTNYAHRFPVFSISIAVARGDEVLCGAVYNPISEELFTAALGGGASVNAMPIRVSDTDQLTDCLLGTGFPYNIRDTDQNNLDHFSAFAVRTQGIRRCGSAALDLCFVACGRLDGFWELNLKPWDIAAGMLIVREAGGNVTDFRGDDIGLDGSKVLASNGRIHGQMKEVLAISE